MERYERTKINEGELRVESSISSEESEGSFFFLIPKIESPNEITKTLLRCLYAFFEILGGVLIDDHWSVGSEVSSLKGYTWDTARF